MNSIGIIEKEKMYTVATSSKMFYDGTLTKDIHIGDFVVEFLNMDFPNIIEKLNPIVYQKDYLDDYILKLQIELSEEYDFIVTGMLVNCIEFIISSSNTDDIINELTKDFVSFAGLQNIIPKYLNAGVLAEEFERIMLDAQAIHVKIDFTNKDGIFMIYYMSDLFSLLAFDINEIKKNNIVIKRCENCGKYFIPQNRSDEKYCDKIFKNNKTCKEVGYEMKLKKDSFKSEYRKAYKTQHARIKYNSHIPDYMIKHFDPWNDAAKAAMKEYEAKNDIAGFRKWIEENKNTY